MPKARLKQLAQDGATDGQVVEWNNASGKWEPATPTVGDVTAAANLTDNSIVRGDGGAKGVQDSDEGSGNDWQISDEGEMTGVVDRSGYALHVNNTKADGGGGGAHISGGEIEDDIVLRLSDADDTLDIMEVHADNGQVVLGKTFAQTKIDNATGVAYGLDIQHASGDEIDFNTAAGGYRVDTVLVIENDQDLAQIKNVRFEEEVDNGASGAGKTVNWNSGQKQRITVSANTTLTFTAPTDGVGNFLLKLIQGTGAPFTVTWPGNVQWPGGTAPILSQTLNDIDIVSFYYDGTNYFAVASLDFS